MRPLHHIAVQSALFSLAPILNDMGAMDAPSLLIMPLAAALAVLASRDWRWAFGAPAIGLSLVLLGYAVWTLATGRATFGGALMFAANMIPFHLLGTWILVGLFWWPGRRARRFALTRVAA